MRHTHTYTLTHTHKYIDTYTHTDTCTCTRLPAHLHRRQDQENGSQKTHQRRSRPDSRSGTKPSQWPGAIDPNTNINIARIRNTSSHARRRRLCQRHQKELLYIKLLTVINLSILSLAFKILFLMSSVQRICMSSYRSSSNS